MALKWLRDKQRIPRAAFAEFLRSFCGVLAEILAKEDDLLPFFRPFVWVRPWSGGGGGSDRGPTCLRHSSFMELLPPGRLTEAAHEAMNLRGSKQ